MTTRCARCGGPLPDEEWDARPPPNPRKWCSQSCRQLAYVARLTPVAAAALLARKAATRKKQRG